MKININYHFLFQYLKFINIQNFTNHCQIIIQNLPYFKDQKLLFSLFFRSYR
jgi:hypothetical protein